MRKRNGFSLIECLTAVSIIVLLTAIFVPALSRVRTYAQQLVSARNQRDIITAVTLFACNQDQQFPPSVALCARPDGSWRWQDPRKVRTTRPQRRMAHSSVAGYLVDYLGDGERLLCPGIPHTNPYWQQAWEAGDRWNHPLTDFTEDPLFGSYTLYWNYLGILENGLFRGPSTLYSGPRQSDLLVSDYFGYGESRNRGRFGSCERRPGAEVVDANCTDSTYWSFTDMPLNLRLNAGYTDGHVDSFRPAETHPMRVSETSDGSRSYWEFDPRYPGLFYIPDKACVPTHP